MEKVERRLGRRQTANQTLKRGFEGLNGGSVLAPYQITRGTLPSIAMSRNAGGVLVSDIAVGRLVIGEETTVADLAATMTMTMVVAAVRALAAARALEVALVLVKRLVAVLVLAPVKEAMTKVKTDHRCSDDLIEAVPERGRPFFVKNR